MGTASLVILLVMILLVMMVATLALVQAELVHACGSNQIKFP